MAMLLQKVSGKIGHHDQVTQFPVLIERMFSQKCFTLKAKFLEQMQGGDLIDRDLYDHLMQAVIDCLRHNLAGQNHAQATAAKGRVDYETQFAYVL
jgi:hypothetical protein